MAGIVSVGATPRSRRTVQPSLPFDAIAASLPELLARAREHGVAFRLAGAAIKVSNPHLLPPDVYAALRAQRAELWDLLGGTALHQPSIDLLGQLNVRAVVPQTVEQAKALLAQAGQRAQRPLRRGTAAGQPGAPDRFGRRLGLAGRQGSGHPGSVPDDLLRAAAAGGPRGHWLGRPVLPARSALGRAGDGFRRGERRRRFPGQALLRRRMRPRRIWDRRVRWCPAAR